MYSISINSIYAYIVFKLSEWMLWKPVPPSGDSYANGPCFIMAIV